MNDKGYIVRNFLFAVLIGFLLLISGTPYVKAQKVIQWVPDERVPGYLDDTFTPFLLADQNRTVHAFASQWVEVSEYERKLAIVYRQWSVMGGWTKPVDVLVSPSGDARIHGAYLDSSGIMHVIFWGGSAKDANIFYSQAPVANADSSSAWSPPTVIGERAIDPSSAVLAGDDQGNLIVVYTGNIGGAGVYEVHSNDFGINWTKSKPVFLTNDFNLVPYSLSLYMGQAGKLHAAWNVVTNKGVDISVHYARYDVVENQWSEPVLLNKRIESEDYFGPSFPSIVDNGKNVVIMYNNGNPFSGRPVEPGRPVQEVSMSDDGGISWNDPAVPFYRHLGRSGEHTLVVDSNNVVHALFVQRIEYTVDGEYRLIGGIWHSSLQGGVWSDPDRFITSYAPHDVRGVISQGNVFLAVWREDPGAERQHGIWYSYTILDSPELPVVIPPTRLSDSVLTPTPASGSASALISTPATEIPMISMDNIPSGITSNPAVPLVIAIVPVALILIGVIVMYRFYHNRNN